jgi:hypothetical protein
MYKILLPLIIFIILSGCAGKKTKAPENYELNQPLTKLAPYDEGFPLTTNSIDENAPYKVEDYIKYYSDLYKDKTAPPPFDFNVDLSKKSFTELRLLRSEILSRHGYLFMDYVLRAHFNATKWYKPVFWYNDFQIKLSEQERKFIDRVLKQELMLSKKNYTISEGKEVANFENVVNLKQFDNIHPEITNHLKSDGFVINKAEYEQLFHVYDENYYDYTPSFITTDLYLQVLHMHISKEMQAIEEEKLYALLHTLVSEQYNYHKNVAKSSKNPLVKSSSEWNQTYYAIALSLLTHKDIEVPSAYKNDFRYERDHIKNADGRKSYFLGDSLIDYTLFKPRGNYTRNDTLKSYFQCVKWLNSAYIFLDEDEKLARAISMGAGILLNPNSLKYYNEFSNVVQFLAGDENNLSIKHLLGVINNTKTPEKLLAQENIEKVRTSLYALNPRRFQAKGINETTEAFLAREKLLFTAGRYTFDGEILQRLVHVTEPEPKRKFPKALDVFAAMGNKTAEDILLNHYNENQTWSAYGDSLTLLQGKFSKFNEWNKSIYNKKMDAILTLQKPNSQYPYFMKTPNWQKKNLNTMLASWSELKHDMLLYTEQPSAAEMGDGGDVPPPQKIAYVEAQVDFWSKCKNLLDLNEKMLSQNNLLIEKLKTRNDELRKLADFLLRMSKKELKKQYLTSEEFDSLSYIGGQVENLTLNIIDSPETFMTSVSTPDRYMSIVADVYTYKNECLEEGVGLGDEIYVIAEINGLLYLTRGGVFSHYEFTQPSSERLTDEEWQKIVLDKKQPPQASWMDIKISVPKLKTAPNFNLY